MAKSKALGKNLDELMFGIEEKSDDNVKEINIDKLIRNENQPRKHFDEEKLNELAESIKEKGVIQPIIVSPFEDKYVIIVGERRWRAAKKAGLQEIPCIIKDYAEFEKLEIALIENIQREDLNPIEEATAYEELIKHLNITQEELAKKIGKSRTTITNTIRLLKLPKNIQNEIIEGNLTEGHGRYLLSLDEEKTITEIAKKIKDEKLSIREVEKIISKIKKGEKEIKNPKKKREDVILQNESKTPNSNLLSNNDLVEDAISEYENIVEEENQENYNKDENAHNYEEDNIYNKNNTYKNEETLLIETDLCKIFRTKVEIKKVSQNKGKVEIYFKNEYEFNRILEYIGYGFNK